MFKNKELKSLRVADKDINYIEFTTDSDFVYDSTTFIQFKKPNNYAEIIGNLGFHTSNVIVKPALENDIDTITLLSLTVSDNNIYTHVIFEKDNEVVEVNTATSSMFLIHVVKLLISKKDVLVDMVIDNSLKYMNDIKYSKYFLEYVEPTNLMDTGLVHQNETIHYGDKIKLSGLTKITNILSGDLLNIVKHKGVDSLFFQPLGDSYNVTALESKLLKPDGDLFSNLDFHILENELEGLPNKEQDIFEEEFNSRSKVIYNMIDRYKKTLLNKESSLNNDEINLKIEKYKEIIKFEDKLAELKDYVNEYLSEDYSIILDVKSMNKLLAQNEISIVKI